MAKRLTILLFAILLQSCSTLDLAKSLNPFKEDNKGIDATVQVGKNNTKVDNKSLAQIDSTVTTTNNTDIEAQTVEMVSNYKDSPWLILGFALAVAAPSPFGGRKHRKQQETIDELREDLREVRNLAKEEISRRSKDQEA